MSDASVTKAVTLAPTDPVPTNAETPANLPGEDSPGESAPKSPKRPRVRTRATAKSTTPKTVSKAATKTAAEPTAKTAAADKAPAAAKVAAKSTSRAPRSRGSRKTADPVVPVAAPAPAALAPIPASDLAQAVAPLEAPGLPQAPAVASVVPAAVAQAPAVPCGEGEDAEPLLENLADFPVADDVKRAIADMGYTQATLVQAKVVRPALAGRDLLVQSKTGSGKTSAFGIPLVHSIQAGSAKDGRPLALVLLPTRELAHQVAEELTKLGAHKGTKVQAIYGGVPLARQVSLLQRGTDIVVGTPGRVLVQIRRKQQSLADAQTVVLDEADEMLSMGFWDDVTELIRLTPKNRQTLLFSATLPYEVAKSASHLMRDVVRLDLSGDDLTVSGIDNCIVHVKSGIPKPRQLLYILEGERPSSAIIFCNTRNETELLAKYLTQSGFVAEPLSGNFRQKERDRTMARIKSGELRFMVATDIAARGIDIDDLTHVVNYALPEFCEVYLHRVGRTGRAGKIGKAISLVDGKGLGTLSVLEREFGIAFVEMTLPPEADVIRARSTRIMKELREKASMAELSQHLPVALDIVNDANSAQVVAFLLKAYFNGQAGGGKPRLAAAEAAQLHADDVDPDSALADLPAATPAQAFAKEVEATDGRAHDDDKNGDFDPAAAGGRTRRRSRGRGRGSERDAERDAERGPANNRGRTPRTPEVAVAAPRRQPAGGNEAGRSTGRDRLPYEVIDASEILRLPARGPRPHTPAVDRVQVVVAARRSTRAEAPGSAAGAVAVREPAKEVSAALVEPLEPGMCRLRVNIGFDDGFKGRGAVAKKICALAGLNEGIVSELESRRDHAVLKARQEVVEMVRERVDGARLGKKVLSLTVLS